MQKLKLYNGKSLAGFTEDNIKELREEAEREGMLGISPRYVQDKISNALVGYPEARSVNPFMVLNELEAGAKHHPPRRLSPTDPPHQPPPRPNAFVASSNGLSPARTAISTAVRLITGNVPGKPRQTGQVWLFGERPNVVLHPQNILVFVRNCACTSTPMTTS